MTENLSFKNVWKMMFIVCTSDRADDGNGRPHVIVIVVADPDNNHLGAPRSARVPDAV